MVSAVNFNSPGQVVIAGAKEAVERAAALCKEAGAKRALPLAVSVPSHCALMKPAAEQLAVTLEEITLNAPATPVLNNVDVKAEQKVQKFVPHLFANYIAQFVGLKPLRKWHKMV